MIHDGGGGGDGDKDGGGPTIEAEAALIAVVSGVGFGALTMDVMRRWCTGGGATTQRGRAVWVE